MTDTIDLRLFATLAKHMPADAHRFTITPGITVAQLIDGLSIDAEHAKLIFINGSRATRETKLFGGERVGIFPPVGGG